MRSEGLKFGGKCRLVKREVSFKLSIRLVQVVYISLSLPAF